ncbi:uncharacterized protein LOC124135408 [Haliotis rufescens]|uniref:uncharacterized protein LOC124135408 n=1 Tax=Haliotis rufescens TaxID=6454 RepID=UPI00201F5748|nr:uncharacterized protein LOC124135408 [Haliotis rufescens]
MWRSFGDLRERSCLICELSRFYAMDIWDEGIYWSSCSDYLDGDLYLDDYSRRHTGMFLMDVAAVCNEHSRLTNRCERIRRLEEEMLDHYRLYEDQYEHRYRLGSRFAQLEDRIRRMKAETRYLLHRTKSALPHHAWTQNGRYQLYDKPWFQSDHARNSEFQYNKDYHIPTETHLSQLGGNAEYYYRTGGQDDTIRARSAYNTPRTTPQDGLSVVHSEMGDAWIQDGDRSPSSTANTPRLAARTGKSAVLSEKIVGTNDSDMFQQRLREMLGESETCGKIGLTGSEDVHAHSVAAEKTERLSVVSDDIKDSSRLFEKKLTETIDTFRQNVVEGKDRNTVVEGKDRNTEVDVKEDQQEPCASDPTAEQTSPRRTGTPTKHKKKTQLPRKQAVTGGLGNDKLNQQIIEGLTRNVNERFYQTCSGSEREQVNFKNNECDRKNGNDPGYTDQQQTAREQMQERARGLETLLKNRNKYADSKLPRRKVTNQQGLTEKDLDRGFGTGKERNMVTDLPHDSLQAQTGRKLRSPRQPMKTLNYTEAKRETVINNVRKCMIKDRSFSIVSDHQKTRRHYVR